MMKNLFMLRLARDLHFSRHELSGFIVPMYTMSGRKNSVML